jgi:hypothetical protein
MAGMAVEGIGNLDKKTGRKRKSIVGTIDKIGKSAGAGED